MQLSISAGEGYGVNELFVFNSVLMIKIINIAKKGEVINLHVKYVNI